MYLGFCYSWVRCSKVRLYLQKKCRTTKEKAFPIRQPTVVQSSQQSGRRYWATHLSARLFARTAHAFACSALLASLACSAALVCSLPSSWDSGIFLSIFQVVLNHCADRHSTFTLISCCTYMTLCFASSKLLATK